MRSSSGAQIGPTEVVGRDALIDDLWRTLQARSVLMVAARRMGKTTILKKMMAEPRPGTLPIYHDLAGVRTPQEFVSIVFQDVESYLTSKRRKNLETEIIKAEAKGG